MGQKTVRFCDRCLTDLTNKDLLNILSHQSRITNELSNYELCDECFKEILLYLAKVPNTR